MYLCLSCQNRLHSTRCSGFGSLMNIDKLIQAESDLVTGCSFGSLMNIDKLIRFRSVRGPVERFGSLMNIDKLIPAE